MRYWSAFLAMNAVAVFAAEPKAGAAAQFERDGRSLFLACEFKQATQAFERALLQQPDSPVLHYWLGKSYARLAEVSSPLSAPKNARRARANLEEAVKLDPRNQEYLLELFDFYVDSPEWFHGGLERAAVLLERICTGEFCPQTWREQLADSRKDHSGGGWWTRRAILWTSGAVGHGVPQQ